MSAPIRFNIHQQEGGGESWEVIVPDSNPAYDPLAAMFAMMDASRVLGPILEGIWGQDGMDPMELAVQASLESYRVFEKKNIRVTVDSQRYDTTKKDFESCAICQEDYEDDDMISVVACEHIFHTKCVIEWGQYKPECPVCKKEIPSVYVAR